MTPTSMKWACFHCRKTFKKTQALPKVEPFLCPDCRQPMSMMGKAFRSPKKDNLEQWKKAEELIRYGFLFHPNGGARPKRLKEVPEFLAKHVKKSPGQKLLERFEQGVKPTKSRDQGRIRISSGEGKPKYVLLGTELKSWQTLEIMHNGAWALGTFRTSGDGGREIQPHVQLQNGERVFLEPNLIVRFAKL